LLPAGCGKHSNNGHVAGRVTVAGTPLSKGAILFENVKGGVSLFVNVNADGAYVVKTYKEDGLPPGDYRVAIRPEVATDVKPPLVMPPDLQKAADISPIPVKYRSVATSGLTIQVKQGSAKPFDFDLTP
jgi:hypothetical protein